MCLIGGFELGTLRVAPGNIHFSDLCRSKRLEITPCHVQYIFHWNILLFQAISFICIFSRIHKILPSVFVATIQPRRVRLCWFSHLCALLRGLYFISAHRGSYMWSRRVVILVFLLNFIFSQQSSFTLISSHLFCKIVSSFLR